MPPEYVTPTQLQALMNAIADRIEAIEERIKKIDERLKELRDAA